MNMVAVIFWLNTVVIVTIGAGVIYTVVRDLAVDSSRK